MTTFEVRERCPHCDVPLVIGDMRYTGHSDESCKAEMAVLVKMLRNALADVPERLARFYRDGINVGEVKEREACISALAELEERFEKEIPASPDDPYRAGKLAAMRFSYHELRARGDAPAREVNWGVDVRDVSGYAIHPSEATLHPYTEHPDADTNPDHTGLCATCGAPWSSHLEAL